MEYQIIGEPMPVVECRLNAGEAMKTEAGSMVWMSPNIKMATNMGGKGLGGMLGRMISGDSMFQNTYTAQNGPGYISFGSSFTGSIRAFEVGPGRSVICQKKAFLASELGVDVGVHFQKKIMTGLFGGDGFIMQKLSGNGMAFIEIDGYAVERELAAGESIMISTGNLAMMEESCTIDVEDIKGVSNWLFGGEDVFLTKVTGPGKIILQTMTLTGFASALMPFIEKKGNK